MMRLSGFADEIHEDVSVQLSVMRDIGIGAIELRGVDGRNISQLSLEETKMLYRKLHQNGFNVSALGSPLGKISINDPFAPHLALFDHMMKQAQILETPYVRLFSFYDAFEDRDQVLARMETFIEHTPSGITLLHENEKEIYGDTADRCLDLLTYFNSPVLRATFDPANFIQVDEPVLPAFDKLAPYIAYVHVKDALYSDHSVTPAGLGDGNWPALIDRLRAIGYTGYLSLEPHLANFTGLQDLEQEITIKADKSQGEVLFRLAAQYLQKLF